MRYLLDTDTCIDLLRGHSATIERASAVSPHDCSYSVVTLFELLTGAAKFKSPARQHARIAALLGEMHELPFEREAAQRAADVRAQLGSQGIPIGPYATLLAGQALASGLTLVSSNTCEFSRVPGLQLVDWRK